MPKLTPDEIAKIRERVESATPAPWKWSADSSCWSLALDKVILRSPRLCDDMGFIAHSIKDIPRLLSDLEAANAENERLKEALRERNRRDSAAEGLYYAEDSPED